MNKILKIMLLCGFLTGCGDNPFDDYDKINDTEYARIRIEMQRCAHINQEGSFTASMRFSPVTACLKHLKTRIVTTGKAKPDSQLDLED